MNIEFIGHAGFCIRSDSLQVLIDPWITPSTFEKPIMQSFASSHQSIDYLIPEPIRKVENFVPDIILMSHFHSHHSSKVDIEYWLTTSKKPITIVGPSLYPKEETAYAELFANTYPQHTFRFLAEDSVLNFGAIEVRCISHTEKGHFAYFIKSGAGSFLHLADARINRMSYYRNLDVVWHKFENLAPTLFSGSVGSTSSRGIDEDGGPYILENSFQSPVEAANLIRRIKPKVASVMGIYNFSIWKNRTEFGVSPYEIEAYFRWAIQHLDPGIDVAQLRPGMNFEIDKLGNYALRLRPLL